MQAVNFGLIRMGYKGLKGTVMRAREHPPLRVGVALPDALRHLLPGILKDTGVLAVPHGCSVRALSTMKDPKVKLHPAGLKGRHKQ